MRKPIHKYNGGQGATLCHTCKTIINIGLTEALFCNKCKNKIKAMSEETIHGFDIPKRELTKEEAERPITLERFNEWHSEVGEDFCDQVGHLISEKALAGFLAGKYPSRSYEIFDIVNEEYSEALSFQDFYGKSDGIDLDKFYTDLSEFINLTQHCKANVNQILIQVMEHYNPK